MSIKQINESQTPGGVIYDAGYRPFDGSYGSRLSSLASIIGEDIKRGFGSKRRATYKVFISLLAIGMFIIAVIAFASDLLAEAIRGTQVIDPAAIGVETLRYSGFFGSSAFIIWFLSAMVAPWLISQERKNNVIPLYLARPIGPFDYVLAKAAAIFGVLFVFTVSFALLLYFVKMGAAADPWAYFVENYQLIPTILLAAIIVSLFNASIAMGVASLMENPGVAAGVIIGVPWILNQISGIFILMTGSPYVQLIDVGQSVTRINDFLFYGELPDFDASSVQGLSGQFGDALQSGLQPLPIEVYALEFLVIVSVLWIVAVSVYKKEASK